MKPYVKPYYAMTIDPIHVGTGGTRLERVDLSIVRDPATKLPKIPGSSISGPARAYTALETKKYRWEENGREYSCAGRGGEGGEKHCGMVNPACPVCVPYGFSKGTGNSLQGLAQFFDAHILLFPVASMIGPVWVTSPLALEAYEIADFLEDRFYPLGKQVEARENLNFGWIMLEKAKDNLEKIDQIKKKIPEEIPEFIKQRVVLVSDTVFPKIVNSNLEVRTSVSIDPDTGAAEEKALFTYEAIPRGTILKFDVVYNSGEFFKVGDKDLKLQDGRNVDIQWVKEQVEEGLKLFEVLGIGGMNTRGMGRVRVLNLEEVNKDAREN
ncbi:CRISPR-associated RAMP protein, Cmr4 family [Thermotoga petrophila RKU-10]|jgi:CRISPR-associated protein Cmr4|uniref:CRISPR-associated RAMP protein, Cmr4 family n=2 Tax=Thermotoga petrophila TaxID=93929 RepID=D2C6B8_THEP2|nr:type III-B CRISPR module RAMP protein Cmr4 [Thermotoga petrophila]ADA66504.1 CRISPR-associated RAMP protein, Cmr4 family [Thermotoga petrophila RKU-10]KUK22755.1 MAG: CRISPR-associated RAMP protein, Cmr4 family [Thermotoga petrophila]